MEKILLAPVNEWLDKLSGSIRELVRFWGTFVSGNCRTNCNHWFIKKVRNIQLVMASFIGGKAECF